MTGVPTAETIVLIGLICVCEYSKPRTAGRPKSIDDLRFMDIDHTRAVLIAAVPIRASLSRQGSNRLPVRMPWKVRSFRMSARVGPHSV